jgi:hypothetical protein
VRNLELFDDFTCSFFQDTILYIHTILRPNRETRCSSVLSYILEYPKSGLKRERMNFLTLSGVLGSLLDETKMFALVWVKELMMSSMLCMYVHWHEFAEIYFFKNLLHPRLKESRNIFSQMRPFFFETRLNFEIVMFAQTRFESISFYVFWLLCFLGSHAAGRSSSLDSIPVKRYVPSFSMYESEPEDMIPIFESWRDFSRDARLELLICVNEIRFPGATTHEERSKNWYRW